MERLLKMIVRQLVNKGMTHGIKAVSQRGQRKDDQSPEARQLNREGQQNTRGLRNATRMLRRISKF